MEVLINKSVIFFIFSWIAARGSRTIPAINGMKSKLGLVAVLDKMSKSPQ